MKIKLINLKNRIGSIKEEKKNKKWHEQKKVENNIQEILQDSSQGNKQVDISLFVKVGIVVLSIIAVIGFGIKIMPNAISVSSTGRKRDLPIYCVNTDENKVALSFDAAWGNDDTRNILNILAKHDVKVTFFMTGEWVNKYPDDVKAIAEAGHDLGNHSENHKQMSQLSRDQCTQEIMKVHNRVKELTGIEMNLFRAPYGDYNNMVVGTARDCHYYTIQWDIDVYATTLKLINTRA